MYLYSSKLDLMCCKICTEPKVHSNCVLITQWRYHEPEHDNLTNCLPAEQSFKLGLVQYLLAYIWTDHSSAKNSHLTWNMLLCNWKFDLITPHAVHRHRTDDQIGQQWE